MHCNTPTLTVYVGVPRSCTAIHQHSRCVMSVYLGHALQYTNTHGVMTVYLGHALQWLFVWGLGQADYTIMVVVLYSNDLLILQCIDPAKKWTVPVPVPGAHVPAYCACFLFHLFCLKSDFTKMWHTLSSFQILLFQTKSQDCCIVCYFARPTILCVCVCVCVHVCCFVLICTQIIIWWPICELNMFLLKGGLFSMP